MRAKGYSKILLVRLAYNDSLGNHLSPPIGLGYIAESLKRAQIEYRVFDMGLFSMGYREFSEDKLMRQIHLYQPDLIGISMQSFEYLHHYELFYRIKKIFPKIKIVLGGHHISSYREKVLAQCTAVDFGVVLEGEETIVELCRGKAYESMEGFIFRMNNHIICRKERRRTKDLDAIPYPRYLKFPMDKYLRDSIGIVTSRGCPYNCTYCSVGLSIGKEITFRSPQNILEEIEYWFNMGKRKILIYDDNFALLKDRVFRLCILIQRKKFSGIEFILPNGVRADKLSKDLLVKMKQIGFSTLAIGVESANDDVLTSMKKGERMQDIDEAVMAATELGFHVFLFFIIGLPGETPDGAYRSIRFALKYPVAKAPFFNPIPYPGTQLFNELKANGYLLKDPEYYLNNSTYNTDEPVFDTPEFPARERKIIMRKARKADRNIRAKYKLRNVKRFRALFYPMALVAQTQAYNDTLRNSDFLTNLANNLKKAVRII